MEPLHLAIWSVAPPGHLPGFQWMVPSWSGGVAVAFALLDTLGAKRVFGWHANCGGIEQSSNGGLDRWSDGCASRGQIRMS